MVDTLLSATSWLAGGLVAFTTLVFGRTLLPGRKPLVARFAEAEDPSTAHRPDLQPYLRRLTVIWTVVLSVGTLMLFARPAAAAGSRLQMFFFVAPGISIIALFLGERWWRARAFGAETVGGLAVQYRVAARILRTQFTSFRSEESSAMTGFAIFLTGDIDRTLIVGGPRACTVGQIQRAAAQLSARLPSGQRVAILCDDRTLFLAAVLACWAARRTVVLPPSNNSDRDDAAWRQQAQAFVTDAACPAEDEAVRLTLDDFWQAADKSDHIEFAVTLPGDHEAVIFHTSGSTGQPTAHVKLWSELVGAADAMTSLLGSADAVPTLGGTVSPAHMFGFEMLVMQPLRSRAVLYAPRIAFPSDLRAFAESDQGEKWLVTTPFHLRLFVRAGTPAAGLTRVISATMPLDEGLAQEFERSSGAKVGEIYGSTESGCLGYRRTAHQKAFTPAPGVAVQIVKSGGVRFCAAYLRHPVVLNDRLELDEDGFHLLGRDFDTVKVAGKRASLSALTRMLQNVSGIEDGCFFDATRNGHTRLAAFVVAPGVARESIREALSGQVDAAFLPRPLIVLDSLPRDINGKLQHQVLERLLAEASPRSPVGFAEN